MRQRASLLVPLVLPLMALTSGRALTSIADWR